jgi:hypothetical protein
VKLQAGSDIDEFVELNFKPGSWDKEGIPEQGCRIRQSTLEKLMGGGSHCDADELIYGLMDWLDVTDEPEPALATLRQLLDRHYPSDGRTAGRCRFVDEHGVDRTFRVGPVDRSQDVITWQRDAWVMALAQPSKEEDGRIVVAAPGPLSLSVATRILALTMERFMDAPFESYQGAIRMSGSTANFYAWERGQTTTCHWLHGLGSQEREGHLLDCSSELFPLPEHGWLAPNQVAIMVGVAAGYLR